MFHSRYSIFHLPYSIFRRPNRALDFGELDEMKRRHEGMASAFPLPDPATTLPSLVIVPHRNAAAIAARDPQVANEEEL